MKLLEALSYERLMESYQECIKGTLWKDSAIRFSVNHSSEISDIVEAVENGSFEFKPFYETIIRERGKERLIRSQTIGDRIVHKAINVNIVKPTFEKSYIYDNSASQTRKGVDFALRRLKCHLNRAYRKWGGDFYILQMDIRKYFDTIPHDYIKKLFNKIDDPAAVEFCNLILDSYGSVGIGLGSEVCQSIALMCLNEMDHIIKERLKIKEYGRYMDDAYIISDSKQQLKEYLKVIDGYLANIGLQLNKKKTNIYPIKNGIKFLGFRHQITNTGHVIVKAKRESVTRSKRKMRKLRKKIDEGQLTYKDAYQHYTSVKGHIGRGNCYHQAKCIGDYYDKIFIYGGSINDNRRKIKNDGK